MDLSSDSSKIPVVVVYHICKCTHYSNACGPICSYFLAIIRSLHDEANLLGG